MSSSRRDLLKLAVALAGGTLAARVLPRVFSLGQAGDKPNIIIIVFDTMTARHLSVYGYPRQTTPNLERFAQRATVYHSHFSSGSYTIPGTASILTGLYPWHHRALNPSGPVERGLTGGNIFHAAGPAYYRLGWGQNLWADMFLRQFSGDLDVHLPEESFAFRNPLILGDVNRDDPMNFIAYEDFMVGGAKMDTPYPGSVLLGMLDIAAGHGENLNPLLGELIQRQEMPFNRFFYYQNHAVFQGIADSVRTLEGRGQPFFCYYHLWSPHDPYAPTKQFSRLFNDDLHVTRKPRHPLIPAEGALSDEELDNLSREYDCYIANLDFEFGAWFDQLEASGALDNSYVIVLSDHGELFERGYRGHFSPLMYDHGIHIPLLISAPGQKERKDIYVPTNNVDLLPTLAALTGGPAPTFTDGQLLPGYGGVEDNSRTIYCVDAKLNSAIRPIAIGSFAVIRGTRKLILYTGYEGFSDMVELYDLKTDPDEMHDLANDEPDTVKQMLDELSAARTKADEPFMNSNSSQ